MAQLVPAKLNPEKDATAKRLTQEFKVRGFPSILFLDVANDELVGRINGYVGPRDFVAQAESFLSAHKPAAPAHADKKKSDAKTEAKGGKSPPSADAAPAEKPEPPYDVDAALKANPDDGEAHARLSIRAAGEGNRDAADRAMRTAERLKYDGEYLSRAYLAYGDMARAKKMTDLGLIYYRKADTAAKTVADQARAKLALAEAYEFKRDRKLASKYAKELLALDGAPEELVEKARKLAE